MPVCEHFYPDRVTLWDAMASRVARCLQRSVSEGERATLLVSGGSSPLPLFEALSVEELAWRQIDVGLVDERWVPETHPASNTARVRGHLLQNAARQARFQRTYVPDTAASERAATMNERAFWTGLVPAVSVLGMGSDFHTASIFPNAEHTARALADDAPAILHTFPTGTPDNPPFDRVTVTAPVLKRSRELMLLILGDEKRERYESAKNMDAANVVAAPIVSFMHTQDVRLEVYGAP